MLKVRTLVTGVVMLGLATGLVFAAAAPSIEEIMTKAHKTKTGLRDQIKKEAEAANPNWSTIQAKTKEFVELATALDKNEPPKGSKESWKKLSQEYVEQVKALDVAAGKKDAKALSDANKKLGANCKGCHDEHQP